MQKPLTVVVTDIANNVTRRPAFMTIELNGRHYPERLNRPALILRALEDGIDAQGTLQITPIRLVLADEYHHVFQTLAPTAISTAKLGLYRSKTRILLPTRHQQPRLMVALELTCGATTYYVLNQDVAVVPALLAWLQSYRIALDDPLALATTSIDWVHFDNADFERLTAHTTYFAWRQTVGVALPD